MLFSTAFIFPAYANAESFFVNKDFDALERKSLEADALHSGRKSLFFVERAYYNSLTAEEVSAVRGAIEYLMTEFDNKIYPKLREVFGSEDTPGADADDKIKIVLHRMKGGVGGYVRETDIGESEIIYININEITNRALAPAYLAHEFQHLITFNEKNIRRGLKEEQWLNEARSEYAPTLAGYNDVYKGSYLEKRVNEFLAHPSDALLDWRGRSADHASVSMFMHYLVKRFGVEILTKMMQSYTVGAESINEALSVMGRTERFDDIFKDWVLAVYMNSPVGNLNVLPSTLFRIYDNNSSGASFVTDNWSGQWHRFVPGAIGEETTLHIRVNSKLGSAEGLYFPYIISDFFGGAEVRLHDISKGSIFSVDGFGRDVSSVVVAPTFANYDANLVSYSTGFSIEGFTSDSSASRFAEGALVRAKGDPRVYIVKNSPKIGEVFTRWIQTEEIFGFYKHFSWNDIIEIKPELLADFEESFLIRKAGDYKVYKVDALGNKKWLNMTPQAFEAGGYRWDGVYEVNDKEFNWYR